MNAARSRKKDPDSRFRIEQDFADRSLARTGLDFARIHLKGLWAAAPAVAVGAIASEVISELVAGIWVQDHATSAVAGRQSVEWIPEELRAVAEKRRPVTLALPASARLLAVRPRIGPVGPDDQHQHAA
jgi:hypothetical protein